MEKHPGHKTKNSAGIQNRNIYFSYKSLVCSHKSISHTAIALQNIKKSIMKNLDFNVFLNGIIFHTVEFKSDFCVSNIKN